MAHGEGTYLPPIFTIGHYVEQNNKKHMPLAIQVHHAVCDDHVGKFAESLQGMAMNFSKWLCARRAGKRYRRSRAKKEI